MEPDSTTNGAVRPPPLNSDHLNYLIWRYLQEAGYGEAAVKLQRDWKVEPESLPFAKHIKGPALVSLVQKGLRYHHLSLTVDEQTGRPSRHLDPSMFFFGPEGARPEMNLNRETLIRPMDVQRSSSPMGSNMVVPKKRETDPTAISDLTPQPVKKSRRAGPANSDRNGSSTRKPSAALSNSETLNAMDVDRVNGDALQQQNARSPSAGEVLHNDHAVNGNNIDTRMEMDLDISAPAPTSSELNSGMPEHSNHVVLPLVHTLVNGRSFGIQVVPAKVTNLSHSTRVLSVPDDDHVTKMDWQPGNVHTLIATGNRFAKVWQISQDLQQNGQHQHHRDLFRPIDINMVTAFAWQPNGNLLAVATYSKYEGSILHIFNAEDLTVMEAIPSPKRIITSLKWLPTRARLVGTALLWSDRIGETSTISNLMLWDLNDMEDMPEPASVAVSTPLMNIEIPTDSDTTRGVGKGVVWATGEDAVYSFRASDDLSLISKDTPQQQRGDNWTFIRCLQGAHDEPVVIAASANTARIWLPSTNIVHNDAHDARITGLEVRPRPFSDGGIVPSADFATSSMDGSVKVWRYDIPSNSISTIHELSISHSSPVMGISYSIDGFCLAGASYGNVRIWNAEHAYNLMASWQPADHEWRGALMKEEDTHIQTSGAGVNGDTNPDGAEHSLVWHTDSKKLAFGLGSQIAVIDFER